MVNLHNDVPVIEVVANTLEENSAVEGTVAGTFTATDEETPRSGLTITFTPGTNAAGYYAIDGGQVRNFRCAGGQGAGLVKHHGADCKIGRAHV